MILSLLLTVLSWEIDSGTIQGYYSLEEVLQIINSVQIGRTETIGHTVQNREIKTLVLGEGNTKILVVGLHHARELISVTQVLDIINYLQDEKSKHLLEKAEIWLIPALNVDGLAYISQKYKNTSKIMNIRKNRQPECQNQHELGVDLNRNYDSYWGYNDIGSSANPCAEDYRGKTPFSQPETQAIQNLALNNFTLALSYHSWGDDYFTPFCSSEKMDPALLREGYANIFEDLEKVVCESCKIGTGKELIGYEVNGCFADYLYDIGAFSVSVEIGGSFHPNKQKIQSVIEKHRQAWVFLFERALPYLNIEEWVSVKQNNMTLVTIQTENIGLSGGQVQFYIVCSQKITLTDIQSEYQVDYKVNQTWMLISVNLQKQVKSEIQISIQPQLDCQASKSFFNWTHEHKIQSDQQDPGLYYQVIIGVVCLLLIIVIFLVIFSRKRRKRQYSTVFQPHDSEIDASYV